MARRLSRGRLANINQAGETAAQTAGNAMSASIIQQTRTRDASLYTTDIQIDLGAGAARSVSTAGNANGIAKVLGQVTTDGAQIALLDPTYGVVTEVELVCVETPTTGEDAIGLWYGSAVSASGDLTNLNAVEIIAAANQTVGVVSSAELDADVDGKYLYMVTTGSTAGTYDAGKFIVRLYGYDLFGE
jgi:hypothetical protein